MSGSGSTPTKPVPSVPRKSGWISTKSVFVAPTRKGEGLPKLADLLKNELFVVLEEGGGQKFCSPCGTSRIRYFPQGRRKIYITFNYY